MTYRSQGKLAQDDNLLIRVVACAATQDVPNPFGWAYDRAWKLSATPGWDDAYNYALTSGVQKPGSDESVITDASILSTVQNLLAKEAEAAAAPAAGAPSGPEPVGTAPQPSA